VLLYSIRHPGENAHDDRTARAFVFPAALIFLIACVVMFAPWDWDNTKIMIWSYLVVLPFLWSHLIARFDAPLRVAICFFLFFSGFVSLFGGLGQGDAQTI